MKIYRVEWWDRGRAADGRYHQEYYVSALVAAARLTQLTRDVQDSDASIETVPVNTESDINPYLE